MTFVATLALGCDTVDDKTQDPEQGGSGKMDTGGYGPGPMEDCAQGYEPIADDSECLADAGCYALPSGQWCTGVCPESLQLSDADVPQCVPAEPEPGCAEGFEPIADDGECLADVACYELPDGSWCTVCAPSDKNSTTPTHLNVKTRRSPGASPDSSSLKRAPTVSRMPCATKWLLTAGARVSVVRGRPSP